MIGFFLYSTVVDGGSNATYTITGIRYGRVVHVELRSGNKLIAVQPEVYSGPGIRLDEDATPFPGGMLGKLVLVP